jgi:Zn-dependent membrane protease YugP
MNLRGNRRRLALFGGGLFAVATGMVGAVADIRWLFVAGMIGFMSFWAIGMLYRWVTAPHEWPASSRWTAYGRTLSLPLVLAGVLLSVEWLLWVGAGLLGASILATLIATIGVSRPAKRDTH